MKGYLGYSFSINELNKSKEVKNEQVTEKVFQRAKAYSSAMAAEPSLEPSLTIIISTSSPPGSKDSIHFLMNPSEL